ncbi:thiamine kinase-like enzyme [Salirhabdus euzebyi]|uniref:Thiamine kinase-like enzyme n=1 Tax=Salirhabdus euzebyi TaxID=394506 RepID=A0A841PU29_9BACI|nr:hypothetical protein [Salirhabdus euzebyi]MBB6452349.1 thiamine kinase-like enzyme [Salirhabdus euzebyi]
MSTLKWNNKKVKLEKAREWIKDSFDECVEVIGPIEIFRSNDWGITSLFEIKTGQDTKSVVLKIGFLSIFKPSVSIYETLSKLHSKHLPTFLCGETKENFTWLVFEKFDAQLVRELDSRSAYRKMGKTMGRIQKELAPIVKLDDKIPSLPIGKLAVLLPDFVKDKYAKYKGVWKDKLSNQDVKVIIENVTKILSQLNEKLVSIHHLDFHGKNAAIDNRTGEVILFDFEEAVITHPFFTLDKLLREVKELDKVTDKNNGWTSVQQDIIHAYLEVFGKSQKEFDLAMVVAPIVEAYLGSFFIKEVGWENLEPDLYLDSFMITKERLSLLS